MDGWNAKKYLVALCHDIVGYSKRNGKSLISQESFVKGMTK